MMSDTPLRTPFRTLDITTRGKYSVYRRILRTLGLVTPEAADHFFTGFKQRTKLSVDAVLEDVDGSVPCAEMPYQNLLLGDHNVAIFDDPDYDVVVAHRNGHNIEVHPIGELFLDLVDSFKLSTARTFCPRFSYPHGYKAASCINCLNALLGLGYRVTYDGADANTLVIQSPPQLNIQIAFEVDRLSSLVYQMINNSLVSDLTNPEWVFECLKRWHSEQKKVVNMPLVEA